MKLLVAAQREQGDLLELKVNHLKVYKAPELVENPIDTNPFDKISSVLFEHLETVEKSDEKP